MPEDISVSTLQVSELVTAAQKDLKSVSLVTTNTKNHYEEIISWVSTISMVTLWSSKYSRESSKFLLVKYPECLLMGKFRVGPSERIPHLRGHWSKRQWPGRGMLFSVSAVVKVGIYGTYVTILTMRLSWLNAGNERWLEEGNR